MPKSCLPINPWPVGFLGEIVSQGMMINGKAKNPFIITWGAMDVDMFGKVESSIECSSANGQLAQGSGFQDFQANTASVGTLLTAQARPGELSPAPTR